MNWGSKVKLDLDLEKYYSDKRKKNAFGFQSAVNQFEKGRLVR